MLKRKIQQAKRFDRVRVPCLSCQMSCHVRRMMSDIKMTVIQAGNLKNLKSTANKNWVIDIFNEKRYANNVITYNINYYKAILKTHFF